MATVAAYIDGFNLYHGMKTKFARRYLWLDVVELVRRLRPDDNTVAVRYYTALVRSEPEAASRQRQYLEGLQAHCGPALDVRLGWFKPKKLAPCKQCGEDWLCGCPRKVRSYEEKETDVALAAAMVADAALGLAEVTSRFGPTSTWSLHCRLATRSRTSASPILATSASTRQPCDAHNCPRSFTTPRAEASAAARRSGSEVGRYRRRCGVGRHQPDGARAPRRVNAGHRKRAASGSKRLWRRGWLSGFRARHHTSASLLVYSWRSERPLRRSEAASRETAEEAEVSGFRGGRCGRCSGRSTSSAQDDPGRYAGSSW